MPAATSAPLTSGRSAGCRLREQRLDVGVPPRRGERRRSTGGGSAARRASAPPSPGTRETGPAPCRAAPCRWRRTPTRCRSRAWRRRRRRPRRCPRSAVPAPSRSIAIQLQRIGGRVGRGPCVGARRQDEPIRGSRVVGERHVRDAVATERDQDERPRVVGADALAHVVGDRAANAGRSTGSRAPCGTSSKPPCIGSRHAASAWAYRAPSRDGRSS